LVGYWDEKNAPEWDDSQDYQFEENILLREINTMDFKISPSYSRRMSKDMDSARDMHINSGGDPDVSIEYSLFIPYNQGSMTYKDFLEKGMFLSDYWNQDGFIVLDRKKSLVSIVMKDGRAHPVGVTSFKTISHAYSRLHVDMGKTFLFEGCSIADSNSAMMYAHSHGYILSENSYFIGLRIKG
jgi:hypothetical protein